MALVSHSLTTDSRFFDYIGKTSPSATETTVAQSIINSITGFIESYTGRRIQETAYSNEEYSGPREEMLLLRNWPIISTETFTFQYRDSAQNIDSWQTMNTVNYHVDYDNGIVYLAGRDMFVLARFRYRVSYTAGYDYNNLTTFLGDTVAGDLELACWMLSSSIWFKRRGDPDKKSERLGDYAITFGEGLISGLGGDRSSLVQGILDKYRRFEVDSYLTPKNQAEEDLSVFEPEELTFV